MLLSNFTGHHRDKANFITRSTCSRFGMASSALCKLRHLIDQQWLESLM
jgi:hypothetical protein